MQEFVKVARLSEFSGSKCKAVEVSGQRLLLVNTPAGVFAVEDACSHLGAPLSQGFATKDSITCEWHGASFDLRTGEALCAPAKDPISVYEVRVIGDDIEVLI